MKYNSIILRKFLSVKRSMKVDDQIWKTRFENCLINWQLNHRNSISIAFTANQSYTTEYLLPTVKPKAY